MPKKKGTKTDAQAASPVQPSDQNVDADAYDDEADVLTQEPGQATQQQKNMFEQEERKVDPTDLD